MPGVEKVLIGSGLRYDLAVRSPGIREGTGHHHVGGYLKIAPEHTEEGPSKMMKPGIGAYDRFKGDVRAFSRRGGQGTVPDPLFHRRPSGHHRRGDMVNLALGSSAATSGSTRCRPSCHTAGHSPRPCGIASAIRYATGPTASGETVSGAAAKEAAQGLPALPRSGKLPSCAMPLLWGRADRRRGPPRRWVKPRRHRVLPPGLWRIDGVRQAGMAALPMRPGYARKYCRGTEGGVMGTTGAPTEGIATAAARPTGGPIAIAGRAGPDGTGWSAGTSWEEQRTQY